MQLLSKGYSASHELCYSQLFRIISASRYLHFRRIQNAVCQKYCLRLQFIRAQSQTKQQTVLQKFPSRSNVQKITQRLLVTYFSR